MSWTAIFLLAAGSYAIKLFGVFVLGRREPQGPLVALSTLLPAALFAGLIAVMTFADGEHFVIDARAAGLAAAVIAAYRRAPFVVTVVAAMAAAAIVRLA